MCDLGAALGRLAYRLARNDRKVAISNIQQAMGGDLGKEGVEAVARACFEHLGRSAGEVVALLSGKLDPIFWTTLEQEHENNLEDALAMGRGVVAVTGHLGNWELMAAALAARGFPINTVAKRSYDPRFTRMIHEFREERGVHCLYRRDPELGIKAGHVLSSNQVLGLLIDQDTKVPGTFVEFFGKLAYTPTGAAALAHKFNTPMLTIFTHRNGLDSHEIEISKPFMPTRAPSPELGIARDTQILTSMIEAAVRRHPEQWVWMHRRWKTRPSETGPKEGG